MATDPQARAELGLTQLAGGLPALGLALSGGGDSTALLHLAATWAAPRGIALAAVTVDHGLRAESAAEAQAAGHAAAALGIPHDTLRWDGTRATGNLAAAGRAARLELMGDWAGRRGLPAVALGHTRDDLAETLLMRLGRGAGIDGLAAMRARREAAGTVWLRPLLDLGRTELRDLLRARGIGWIDDPGNVDLRRDRARVRAAIAQLGLDPARLADSARHLSEARAVLADLARHAISGARTEGGADLALPRAPFDSAPREVRRMILAAALATVTGADYPPRRDAMALALDALAAGRRTSLGGALLIPDAAALRLVREPAAAARAAPLTGAGIWDRRWHIALPPPAGCHITALPGSAAPALWRGADCLSALPAGGCDATPLRDLADLRQFIGT